MDLDFVLAMCGLVTSRRLVPKGRRLIPTTSHEGSYRSYCLQNSKKAARSFLRLERSVQPPATVEISKTSKGQRQPVQARNRRVNEWRWSTPGYTRLSITIRRQQR